MDSRNVAELQATLQFLQIVAVVIAIIGAIAPVIVGALLWRFSRNFVEQKDFDGLGSRVTAYETFSIQTRERADSAHDALDKHKESLAVELRYIHRDLDELLRRPSVKKEERS